jgi:hypothetical protein
MHSYKTLACQAGTPEARDLAERLATWHDAMVNHERRLRADDPSGRCTSPCPHDEARDLWVEARATFGSEAGTLAFLRSRATIGRDS